jgi:hypothetical protein
MMKVTLLLLTVLVPVAFCVAQTATPSPSNGSTAQQQNSTELQTNPSPSQNTQASGEAAGSGQFAPGSVVAAELTKSVDAKKAKPGDQVLAKTSQDMLSGGQIVIPHGAKIVGHVTQAKPREKGDSESTLGIAFDKVVGKDGREVPLNASIQALAPPISNLSAGNGSGGNPPMSESGGMPGGTGGNPGMGGGRNAGTPAGMGGTPGGNYPPDTGTSTTQGGGRALQPGATGVIGMPELSLNAGPDGAAVISSQHKNVKLDSGTQLMLRVNGKSGTSQ